MTEAFIIGILIGFVIGSILVFALWTQLDKFKNK
jgi:gas vesicle protein